MIAITNVAEGGNARLPNVSTGLPFVASVMVSHDRGTIVPEPRVQTRVAIEEDHSLWESFLPLSGWRSLAPGW